MASIARTLRPLASRISARPCRSAAPWRSSQFQSQARAFSASPVSPAKRYTKDHEWVELSEDGKTGVIGISDYAAHALGDVVYVELPTTPMEVEAGDAIGAVESVKSASDINAPITCKITAVNDLLEEKPGTINKGPEDEGSSGGWVAKIEVGEAGVKDLDDLMDAKAYKEFTEDA
ncbi:probable glycine cleavage system H protein, mitochondrial precursor [Rhynchosporium secalis]|uniref:Glycine cleavage system H protein n=1 Tax=Rhynchosporium secalis TaxID=38038 RepID=A0A1E1LW72_RHYSE|nr:probable glycine cleavage system H protein, mitochondrial precursor [Rhynchosporium secalis]